MDDLAQLSDLARTKGIRVAVAESLTSGQVAHTVGAGEDASEWFAGGIVAYLVDVKERVLGVPPGTDPCSAECAERLAIGARALFLADLCVSTTGVGGPDPEGGHAPGTVYVGWSTSAGSGHRRLQLRGEPEDVLRATTDVTLRLLAFRAAEL